MEHGRIFLDPVASPSSPSGGWKDVTTLLTCHQHDDEASTLKFMESLTKLVSRQTAGALEKQWQRAQN